MSGIILIKAGTNGANGDGKRGIAINKSSIGRIWISGRCYEYSRELMDKNTIDFDKFRADIDRRNGKRNRGYMLIRKKGKRR